MEYEANGKPLHDGAETRFPEQSSHQPGRCNGTDGQQDAADDTDPESRVEMSLFELLALDDRGAESLIQEDLNDIGEDQGEGDQSESLRGQEAR